MRKTKTSMAFAENHDSLISSEDESEDFTENGMNSKGQFIRNVSFQTTIDPIDPTVSFLYKPHSISMLIITILALLYIAFNVVGDDPVMNTKV